MSENHEPLAKVVSGNLLPHFGVFPACFLVVWNHHALQSSLKIHSKWECTECYQTGDPAVGGTVLGKLAHKFSDSRENECTSTLFSA